MWCPAGSQEDAVLLQFSSVRINIGTVLLIDIYPYTFVSAAIAPVVGRVWRWAFGEPFMDKT
jgi:hypothetical protein